MDNFRTLVNFEWMPGKLALLLGPNGAGKSAVIDALWGVRTLVVDGVPLRTAFPLTSRTRWETREEARIELVVTIDEIEYLYVLLIEHSPKLEKSRIKGETLTGNGKPLMRFDKGTIHLHRNDGSPGPQISGDWGRSALGVIAAGDDNSLLTRFKSWLSDDLWLLRPDPRAMSSRAEPADDFLSPDLANLASQVPRWMTQHVAESSAANRALAEVLPGFEHLQLNRSGVRLEASFRIAEQLPRFTVDLSELSDGERQLCGLYYARHLILRAGRLVVFDEPDNYLALQEIQPWLMEVVDEALAPEGPQVWLISHHPELLNQLAPSRGTRFYRTGGPTRIAAFTGPDGLTPAEAVARGWDHA